MNPSVIYSKSGKGVQEASGKTSLLKRADRAVLSAIDGRATLADVAHKVGRSFDSAFEALITQLDRDGFVREVSGGSAAKAPAARGGAAAGGGPDLDFTTIIPIPKVSAKPADPAQRAKEQESALYKARQEAEARAQEERDRLKAEGEAKARAEAEAKFRADAEKKIREETEARLKAEAEAKTKAVRDAALRVAAEAKARADAEKARLQAERAKLEAERKQREEAERKAREEAEKARREAEELRQRLEDERKARETEEKRRREEEERRRKEEEERRAREEAERKAREEEERMAREEAERRAREEEERRARAEAERKAREEEERARRAQEEEVERARREAEEALAASQPQPQIQPEPPSAPSTAATVVPGSLDTLMADLDSFSQREEDERRSREGAERKAKEEKARRMHEDSERRAQEQAHIERREAEERRRKEEEQRRAQEEAERRVREAEEARRQEAEDRKRKARESMAAAQQAPPVASADDIGVTDEDLDMEDVRRDEALVAKDSRQAQREREREERERERETREREREARERERRAAEEPLKPSKPRRPVKWGKPLAITLFVLLAAAIGVLHVMPIPTEPYERAASEALGRQVRISSARLSLFTGVRLNLQGVKLGDTATIATVHAYPELGSLFGERKSFSRIELEGATVAQQALGEAMFAKMKGESFSVGRVVVRQLKVEGGLALPQLEADALIGPDGAVRSVTLRGPEDLVGKVTPSGGNIEFDLTASSFALPVLPAVSLNSFAMKGTATRQGMNVASWGGAIYDGALNGVANVRWTGGWQIDGVVTARNINAAVLAPALLSEGRAEGTGKFSMSAQDPAKLANGGRIEGKFTVYKGVLGSFDLSRLIQTSGRQSSGRTQFAEMTGQGVYDRGAVALRDVQISAGALNAGASADIAQNGALSGRIVADVKTASQTLRQTLVLGGTVKEPQVRN